MVSHKTVLRLVFCRLLNIELRRYREAVDWPTCALTMIELGPCHAASRLVTDERHLFPFQKPQTSSEPPARGYDGQSPASPDALFPQARRHLVGEQLAGWGQADAGFVDDDPTGGGAALDLELAPDHGVDAMTGAMGGAIEPAGGS